METSSSVIDLSNTVTSKYLCRLFSRSELTIMNWRKAGMPHIRIPGDGRDSIRYDLDTIYDWAISTRKRLYLMN